MLTYYKPKTLHDVLETLHSEKDQCQLIAGCTDVIPRQQFGTGTVKKLIDLNRLEELHGITHDEQNRLVIGAGTTHQEISESNLIESQAPLLQKACSAVGSLQIRNRGTLGGNIANASPAADSIPALYCLQAEVILASLDQKRVVPIQDIFKGPGQTIIAKNEVIETIRFYPQLYDAKFFFKKAGQRRGMCCSKANLAFSSQLDSSHCLLNVKIAMGAVAPTVCFADRAARTLENQRLSDVLISKAAQECSSACRPIDDIRSTAAYRKDVIKGMLIEGLLEIRNQQI